MKNENYNVWRHYKALSIGRARIVCYDAVCHEQGYIMSFVGHKKNNFKGNVSFNGETLLFMLHELCTVGYAGTNVIGSRISLVIASVRSSIH
jgi:hypothetical protein